jgi:hypothetical protein
LLFIFRFCIYIQILNFIHILNFCLDFLNLFKFEFHLDLKFCSDFEICLNLNLFGFEFFFRFIF